MPHPDGLPDLFLDRSLGRIKVPDLLRAAGLRLTTLAEHYGMPEDEDIADEEWLELSSSQDWVVFMKDARIRYNRRERDVVTAHSVRCFCLSSQQLNAADMASRYLDNIDAITQACQEPGPFIYAVHKNRIERLPLGTDA
ncbi:hypothetical protein [Candidatus Poriferisocius sp.]|uniref:PIN-like domain-containing protein n=1 Tax=Candidatus Poriferisocius sp. TaxID=3101276 RepID=UPI003B01B147